MRKSTILLSALFVWAAALSAQGRFAGGRAAPELGFNAGQGRLAAEARVEGAPYSGVRTTVMQQTLANGNVISRQEQAKVYRDSQGRVRVEQTSTNPVTGKSRTTVTITDPVASVAYVLNAEAKTYTKTPVRIFARPAGRTPGGSTSGLGAGRARGSAQAQARGGRGRGAQAQTEDLGTQSIEGQPAAGRRMTETIPAGGIGNAQPIQVVRETWVSTALHVPVTIKTSDPRFGVTSMQLSNIVMAEPDPALFLPPADYTPAGGRGARGTGRRPAAQ
jgi:hypothetical protein